MNMKLFIIGLMLVSVPFVGSAHHARVEYDPSQVVELEGTVESVKWTNPHVRLMLRVSGDDATVWQLEGMDVTRLDRAGVPRDLLKVGDAIRVSGDPSTRRANRMFVRHVLLPDHRELLLAVGRKPLWSENVIGSDYPDNSTPKITIGETPEGIFRVWFPHFRDGLGAFAKTPPFTTEGQASYDAYDNIVDDPVLGCTPPGMPKLVTRAGVRPIEFEKGKSVILIKVEAFGLVREIDMSGRRPEVSKEPRPLGYSAGRWEEDTLIIETTKIDWPRFQLYGFEGAPQSTSAMITERYEFREEDDQLIYSIMLEDPVNFTEAINAEGYQTYEWHEGQKLIPFYDCGTEFTE
jgi:hypothetical protein